MRQEAENDQSLLRRAKDNAIVSAVTEEQMIHAGKHPGKTYAGQYAGIAQIDKVEVAKQAVVEQTQHK